ncbi:unnamed protein product, partial [Mesorhabditis spiculigera]
MSHGAIAPELAPNPLHQTSKYKAFAQAVDKALKAFENTNEWADLISALGKLSKVFSSNAKYCDIPKPIIVAKRLSQCLHPALPMGVHLKALETYKQVFDILGTEKLSQLLYLFAVGLFPLMDHCGIKVKSELFTIFEVYLLRLGPNLKPSLPGFLAGVLLGLEEGTEFYDRSVTYLDKVCEAVGAEAFYGCVWEAVLGSPAVRLPALLYVNTKLDKNRPVDEQHHLFCNPELMVEALCAAAGDTGSPLVQRNLLDFLCTVFPLDSPHLSSAHFVKLLQHCLFVVLRRDMSLNRRLFQWLLNPTGSNLAVSGVPVGDDRIDSSFFLKTVLPLIQQALNEYLSLDTVEIPAPPPNLVQFGLPPRESEQTVLVEVRVCRLLLYLQDRPEIGKPVLSETLPIFLIKLVEKDPKNRGLEYNEEIRSFYGSDKEPLDERQRYKKRLEDISKSFNLLLTSLDDGFIWSMLATWFTGLLSKKDANEERLFQLTHFPAVARVVLALSHLDGTSSTRLVHMPIFLRSVLSDLKKADVDQIPMPIYLELIAVCQKLLEEMTQGAGLVSVADGDEPSSTPTIRSPVKKILGDPQRDREQNLVEKCLLDCLALFEVLAHHYVRNRGAERLPLLTAICRLVNCFVDFPLYCLDLDTPIATRWTEALIKVLDVSSWAKLGAACDFGARAACLELLCYVFVRSSQVLEQHKAFQDNKENLAPDRHDTTTVLLKPLLLERELRSLENDRIFEA